MAGSATREDGNERIAYGVAEAAGKLGVSAGFIRLEIGRGRLRAKRCGRRLLIPAAALADYLRSEERH